MTRHYFFHDEHGLRCWCSVKRVWYSPRSWRYQGRQIVQLDAECTVCNVHGGELRPGDKPQPHSYLVRS